MTVTTPQSITISKNYLSGRNPQTLATWREQQRSRDNIKDGRTYSCTTTPYTLTTNPDKIVMFAPDVATLWPGAIVQGKYRSTFCPSHGENRGSSPLGSANKIRHFWHRTGAKVRSVPEVSRRQFKRRAPHCPSRGRWCIRCAVRVSDVCQALIGPELCELLHIGSRITDPCLQQETVHGWEHQMSIEFDRSYIEEVVMLSGLGFLFLILAAVMPA